MRCLLLQHHQIRFPGHCHQYSSSSSSSSSPSLVVFFTAVGLFGWPDCFAAAQLSSRPGLLWLVLYGWPSEGECQEKIPLSGRQVRQRRTAAFIYVSDQSDPCTPPDINYHIGLPTRFGCPWKRRHFMYEQWSCCCTPCDLLTGSSVSNTAALNYYACRCGAWRNLSRRNPAPFVVCLRH
jgi:hypothetical protein